MASKQKSCFGPLCVTLFAWQACLHMYGSARFIETLNLYFVIIFVFAQTRMQLFLLCFGSASSASFCKYVYLPELAAYIVHMYVCNFTRL